MGAEVKPAEPVGVPSPDEWAKGRKCRDVLCLLLFMLFWVVWIFVAFSAYTDGCPKNCVDPMSTFFQADALGVTCGDKNNGAYTNRKNLWVYNPVDPINGRACVDACPTEWFKVPCLQKKWRHRDNVIQEHG